MPIAPSRIQWGNANQDKQWQSWSEILVFLVKCEEHTLTSVYCVLVDNVLEMERTGAASPRGLAKSMWLFINGLYLVGGIQKHFRATMQAHVVLLHFTLSHLTDVAFFTNWRQDPFTSKRIMTHFIAEPFY